MLNWEIEQLMRINWNLENGTLEELEDYQEALNELYEIFECYYGIRCEFDEWTTNENGDIINRTYMEHKLFYEEITKKIYKILIKKAFEEEFDLNEIKEKEYSSGFNDGLVQAQSAMMEIGL